VLLSHGNWRLETAVLWKWRADCKDAPHKFTLTHGSPSTPLLASANKLGEWHLGPVDFPSTSRDLASFHFFFNNGLEQPSSRFHLQGVKGLTTSSKNVKYAFCPNVKVKVNVPTWQTNVKKPIPKLNADRQRHRYRQRPYQRQLNPHRPFVQKC
jgi:hypothetical protein